MSVSEVIKKYFSKVQESTETMPPATIQPTKETIEGYFGDKLTKLSDPKNYVPDGTPDFDIEPLADDIYNTLINAGFIVKRSIVYGLVMFVIVDEMFETYLDITYGTKGVKDYVLNVMAYKRFGDKKISEATVSRKTTDLNEVYSILNVNKNKQIL